MAELAAVATALAAGEAATIGAGTALAAAGQAVTIGSTVAGGVAAKNKGDFQAKQAKVKANEEMVSATRKAQQQRRRAELVQSSQVAGASASGGGVNTPTIYDLIGDTEQVGFEAVQGEIASGENRSKSLLASAKAYKQEGNAAFVGSIFDAAGKGLSGFGKKLPDPWAAKVKYA